LKVNLAKSELVFVNKVDSVDGLVGILGCKVSFLPLKDLDFLLRASYKAKSIFDGIIEKIERQLASWKIMYFLKGSKATLYQDHPFQFAYVFHVSFPSLCWCCKLHIEVSSRLLMGWAWRRVKILRGKLDSRFVLQLLRVGWGSKLDIQSFFF
jgi:hypothetical protein